MNQPVPKTTQKTNHFSPPPTKQAAGDFAPPTKLDLMQKSSLFEEPVFSQEEPVFADFTNTPTRIVISSPQKQKSPPSKAPKMSKPSPPKGQGKRPPNASNWQAYVYVAIICICLGSLLFLGIVMGPQMAGIFWRNFPNYAFINGEFLRYDQAIVASYTQTASYMDQDVIFPGVFVNGVHVGDLTIAEAKEALLNSQSTSGQGFSVTVQIANQTWVLDSTNIPSSTELGNVLEKAYAYGRTNQADIQSTLQTPFRQRSDAAIDLRTNHVSLTTKSTYDTDAIGKKVDEIVAFVTRTATDAQIASFDFNTRTFTFANEQDGVSIDGDALYERILTTLEENPNGQVVTADLIVTPATITTDHLIDNFKLISAYTTDTTSESNRNTNISLACQAINGTVLMPGEVFSFNETTGQRTTEKGYLSAGAIAAGQSIEEVGGGICQVSSTLFNAVARANLEIVKRTAHAWPISYVNAGEDATVNWPNLDFQFKNNTSSPIFIITYFKDKKMSAEIWGQTLGEGVVIELESIITQTISPPTDIRYVDNPDLPAGTSKTTVKARTGYVIETYQVWKKEGVEMKRNLLHTSNYRSYQQVVEYH